jgi:hypothetical protein
MPQRPNTDGALGTALGGSSLNVAYIIRLDVETDPLFAWTGYGDLVFGASETGDPSLDSQTFYGITHLVADIGAVEDSHGSNGLKIVLPGIDLTAPAMQQVVYDKRKWQFKAARIWLLFLDDNGAIIGKPIRVRSGKMDQMKVIETDDGEGIVECMVESAQAYAGEALNTRYSEQAELDATDNSQRYVWQLANQNPTVGKRTLFGDRVSRPRTGFWIFG